MYTHHLNEEGASWDVAATAGMISLFNDSYTLKLCPIAGILFDHELDTEYLFEHFAYKPSKKVVYWSSVADQGSLQLA